MLTGGEPLLHSNLWTLCDRLRNEGIRITLITTGLLVAQHVDHIAMNVDDLFISIDGDAEVHDAIRQTRGGFERIARGVALLNNYASRPHTTARSVVQRRNHARLAETVAAIRALGVDRLSFLAADVSSMAFNRPTAWTDDKRAEIALSRDQLPLLAAAIREVEGRCQDAVRHGFLTGGSAALWRIHDYYSALAGLRDFPPVRCNAPWMSAVLEPGGELRPCFFHAPYPMDGDEALDSKLNSPGAVAFRRNLSVHQDETCQRCVCSLALPYWADV
jgi:MoaA/NifB/PqqE/SkfB family radical SAM enzyme